MTTKEIKKVVLKNISRNKASRNLFRTNKKVFNFYTCINKEYEEILSLLDKIIKIEQEHEDKDVTH